MNYTGSKVAEKILTNMDDYMDRFIKVIPYEYKKVLMETGAGRRPGRNWPAWRTDVEMMRR